MTLEELIAQNVQHVSSFSEIPLYYINGLEKINLSENQTLNNWIIHRAKVMQQYRNHFVESDYSAVVDYFNKSIKIFVINSQPYIYTNRH